MIFESYINKKRNNRLTIMAVLVFCCLMFTASHLAAADHWVYGQVFRVTSAELAEKQKAADDAGIALDLNTLETEKLPYVHIKIYDKATGKLLMTGDALNNGQYTIKVSLTGPPPAAGFDCRVFKTADGKFQLMKEVKDGVNSVSPVGGFNQKKLLVIDDDIIDYKIGSLPAAGVGLVFTRVGLIPVAYIEQSAMPIQGMSNLPPVPPPVPIVPVPGYVPTKFRGMELPFGGALLIFGNFGEPTCGLPGTKVGWYRVTMENITAGTSITFKDPLSKVKTDVNVSVSPMTVTNSTEKLGPFNGEVSGSPIDGLYKVNRDDGDTFYSFPDLRIYWNTSGQNGLFRITVEYFADDGVTVSGEPNVSPLPSPGCFGVAAAPIGELYVRVNNQPLDVTFDGIFLKDGTNYYEVVVGTKFDFNDEGLCSIMNLTQPSRQYGIEIEYTAHHTGNYMRSYSLKAIPNDKSFTVTFADESYPPSPPSILWAGTPAAGDTQFKNFFSWPKACAYIFYLDAVSRVQNGYNYIQWVHKRKAYYINPN